MHSVFKHVLTPAFSQVFSGFSNGNTVDAEATYEVTEWLGLAVLQSPRLLCSDGINPYLSRYTAPEGSTEAPSLRIINWHGLIGASWLTSMLNMCMLVPLIPFLHMLIRSLSHHEHQICLYCYRRQSRIHHAQQWLAISASAHRIEAVGQHDGYSIILLPEVLSPQAQDLGMDVEARGANSETQGTAKIGSSAEKRSGGLQNCMCFEHIDSVVDS
jgi:Ribonuclease P 40kDa (Rpp40) subunit